MKFPKYLFCVSVFSILSSFQTSLAEKKYSKKELEKLHIACMKGDTSEPCIKYVDAFAPDASENLRKILLVTQILGQNCEKGKATSCFQAGQIIEKTGQKKAAKNLYKRACKLGAEEGCSALK